MRRLRSELGMALPIALGVMLVLSIAVFSILRFTGANARGSTLSTARQDAKSVAEGAFNSAASIVAANQTSTALPSCPTYSAWVNISTGEDMRWCGTYTAIDTSVTPNGPTWLVTGQGRVANPSGPGANAITRNVQGKLWLTSVTVTDTTTWRGVFAGAQGDKPLMSDVNARIETPVYVKESDGKPVEISAGKVLTTSFVVYGRLAVTNSVNVSSVGASARPGISWSSSSPTEAEYRVADLRVKDGCSLSTGGPFTTATCSTTDSTGGPTQRFWLPCPSTCTSTDVTSTAYTNVVPNIDRPVENFVTEYSDAAPGATSRAHRCYANSKPDLEKLNSTIGNDWSSGNAGSGFAGGADQLDNDTSRNSSIGTVNLMPDADYYCIFKKADGTTHGSIKWTRGNPGTLQVSGHVFFDGHVLLGDGTSASTTTHGWGRVSGEGYVYVNDYVNMKGDYSGLCGVPDTTADRAANGMSGSPSARGRCLNGTNPSTGVHIWDPGNTTDLVAILSASTAETAQYVLNQFQYQGVLYSDGGFKLQDLATFKGPIVSNKVQVLNTGLIAGWTPLTDLGDLPTTTTTTTSLALVPGSWRG